MTDPVTRTLTVPLPPDEAFRLFTDGIDRWWPKDSHSTSAGDGKAARDVRVEPREGGRILETRHDGVLAEWGRVTEWTPGARLRCTWYPGRGAEDATDLDVRFTADAIGCRVDLTHSGFDRPGAAAAAAAAAASYHRGWGIVLARFAAALVTA